MITGSQVVAAARTYLGTPYELGGRSREGMDCVGLVLAIGRDFGMVRDCDTPVLPDSATSPQTYPGVAWEKAEATIEKLGLKSISLGDCQLGDFIVLRVPLGGASTIKLISGKDGLASFFGVSRFINFLTTENPLVETPLWINDAVSIKRDLKMDVQDYILRLWRAYRYPFIQSSSLNTLSYKDHVVEIVGTTSTHGVILSVDARREGQ